jgi:hypothetical protein
MPYTDPVLGPAAEHVILRPRAGDVLVARLDPAELPEDEAKYEALVAEFAAAVRTVIPAGVEVLVVVSSVRLDLAVVKGDADVGG